MAVRRLGIVMYGVTGRMGLNQHLARSIVAIREQGGVALPNGDRVMPDPILVGRNAEKVAALARQYGIERSTADLDAALKNPDDTVFFDAATTQMRADLLTRAIEAGKHIYCEKPVADDLNKAIAVAKLAKAKKVKNGVVQDKLFLPGLRKIRMLRDAGFFGRMFAVRGEFGYWVFEGDWGNRRNVQAGTTRRKRVAALFSICFATGATSSTICSARCRRSAALVPRTSPSASTKAAKLTTRMPMTRLTPPSSWRMA